MLILGTLHAAISCNRITNPFMLDGAEKEAFGCEQYRLMFS